MIAGVLLVATVVTLVDGVQLFDLVAQLREPLLWLQVVVLPVALALPLRRYSAALLGVAIAVNAYFVGPYLSVAAAEPARKGTEFVVLQFNVLTSSREYGRLLDLVQRHDPDLIALQEVNATWMDQLAPLEARYPHHIAESREDNFGIAAWSRHPLEVREVISIEGLPALHLRVRAPGGTLEVLVVHPLPPASLRGFEERNRYFTALRRYGPRFDLLVGDLNTTPFSLHFRRLVAAMELNSCGGLQRTWPADSSIRIPIDHVLVGRRWRAVTCQVQGPIGSDHLPLVAVIAPSSG
jgi:endonuclease/exonuclease/phosphatase (EEP) superfamily protein YafD